MRLSENQLVVLFWIFDWVKLISRELRNYLFFVILTRQPAGKDL